MVRQSHPDEFIKKRKYEFDKLELQEFIKKRKNELKISHKEIYTALEIPKHYIYGWFGNSNKFYPSEMFLAKWDELKIVLRLKNTKFDKPLTEFIDIPKPDTLACIYHNCKCVSSHLHLVEEIILKVISARLENYKKYLDNYEFEYVKELENNQKIIDKLDKEISGLNKELKTARRNYNKEEYTYSEYQELKDEIEAELEVLENKRKKLKVSKEEKVIVIKKSVPKLKNCIEKYNTLTASVKNKLLKSILKNVYYTKQVKGSEFEIVPEFKI